MRVYPVFMTLEGRPCLVVGGGAVGERKVLDLLAAGAVVTVVSPELTPMLQELAQAGRLRHVAATFTPEQLEGMFLVIGATDDEAVNRQISAAAQARKIPVNIVDAPALCTFIVPATVRRGELTVAISTGGQSPALAKKLRQELAHHFGPEYNYYLQILGRVREKVLARRRDHPDNAAFFHRLVACDLLELLRQQQLEALARRLADILHGILPPTEVQALTQEVVRLAAAGMAEKGQDGRHD